MFSWFKKVLKEWSESEPNHIDVCRKSIDGTPLTVLITPKGLFSHGGWRIESTPESQRGSLLLFSIERDLGKYLEYAIDSLNGKYNNLFTLESLEKISIVVETAIKKKGYTAFSHNGKPYMEFVDYSLDPRDIKKLKQALINYNFNKLSTKQKS